MLAEWGLRSRDEALEEALAAAGTVLVRDAVDSVCGPSALNPKWLLRGGVASTKESPDWGDDALMAVAVEGCHDRVVSMADSIGDLGDQGTSMILAAEDGDPCEAAEVLSFLSLGAADTSAIKGARKLAHDPVGLVAWADAWDWRDEPRLAAWEEWVRQCASCMGVWHAALKAMGVGVANAPGAVGRAAKALRALGADAAMGAVLSGVAVEDAMACFLD